MFDVHVQKVMPNYPQDVHHHRAPTDASVKLLTEMEKAALDRLIGTTRLMSNDLKCVWSIFHSPMRDAVIAMGSVEINGVAENFELHVPQPYRGIQQVREEIVPKIRQMILEHLANRVLLSLFTETKFVEYLVPRKLEGN